MVKRLVFAVLFVLLSGSIFAQDISRSVVAAGGCTVTVSGYSISSTIGQASFLTLSGESDILTQGYQQPQTRITYNPTMGEYILAFPNPVERELSIAVILSEPRDFFIEIFNLAGIRVASEKLSMVESGVKYPINFENFAEGFYLLHIYDSIEKKKLFKVFKIEKLIKSIE
jgi:hypothetical protein